MLLLVSPRRFLASFIFFLAALANDRCSLPKPSPFAFRLANCSLAATSEYPNGIDAWGLVFGISTPMQDVCIMPSFVTNNIVAFAPEICTNDHNSTWSQCLSRRGGVFNKNLTTSDFISIPPQDLPARDPEWNTINPSFTKAGKATVQFASGLSLSNFSFALALEGQNSSMGYLGLANDSAFLQNVITAGYSSVRGIGLYAGSRSVAKPRDGHIVVGGYDAASLAGPFTTYAFSNTTTNGDRECQIQLEIDYLTLHQPSTNGTSGTIDTNLITRSDFFKACVEPYDNLFRMPGSVIDAFKHHTDWVNDSTLVSNQLYIVEPGIYYRNGFNGTLSFTLKDGTVIRIPNEELAHPVRGLDSSGKLVLQPNVTVVNIFHEEALQFASTLGKIFLSQVYLTVNYDLEQFQIAPAISDNLVTPDLVPFPEAAISLSNCSIPVLTSSGMQTGSIVVGVALAVVIVALCIYLFWRQKRSKKRDRTLAAQKREDSERVEAMTLELTELSRRINATTTQQLSSAQGDTTMPITQIVSNMTTGTGAGATTGVSLKRSISQDQPNIGSSSRDQGKILATQAGTD